MTLRLGWLGGALLLVACGGSDPVTTPADGGADATTDGGALPFPLDQTCSPVSLPDAGATRVCDECNQSQCCASRTKLLAFPDALDLASCLAPKSCDDACEAACFVKYPKPAQALLDHAACSEYYCQAACDDPPTACESCLKTNCLAESLACARDQSCWLYSQCGGVCSKGDATCLQACATKYPSGADVGKPLLTCSQTRCATPCK